MAVDVGQAAVEAVVVVRQPLVVEPQKVQDRPVDVVNRRDVFDGLVAEFVGCSVGERSPDARSGQPAGEA